jgi:SAM-dependent methyltransferase
VNAINLSGEGEEPNVRNQQPDWVKGNPHWRSQRNEAWDEFNARVPDVDYTPTDPLPYPDNTFDVVYINNAPIDRPGPGGKPGHKRSEIERILKPGGRLIRDGVIEWVKP